MLIYMCLPEEAVMKKLVDLLICRPCHSLLDVGKEDIAHIG